MPTTAPSREPDQQEPGIEEPDAEEPDAAPDGPDTTSASPVDDAEPAGDVVDQDDDGAADHPADAHLTSGDGPAGPSWRDRLTGPFRRGGTERVLAIVAVLGVLGTLVFAGLWISDRRAEQGESAMAATGEEFLLALTNFDAATLDEDFDHLVDLGTGDFADQADQFFGGDVREALREVQASSRGEVRELYVQSFDGDRGRVFAVVDQTIANNRFPQPQADQLRVELGLRHTGGEWRVAEVLVLEAPDAASGAAGAAGAASAAADGTDAPATEGEGG